MKNRPSVQPSFWFVLILSPLLLVQVCCTSGPRSAQKTASVPATQPDDAIARIRDEGLNRSKAPETLSYLCDVIGHRLTGSPSCKRANEWTRDQLALWGLSDAHLEEWGPFGRGWSLRRFSMQVVEPYTIVLNGYPKAWSPGFDAPVDAEVIWLDAKNESDLEPYKGKIKGKIVLIGQTRETEARFEPLATRLSDDQLAKLADSASGSSAMLGQPQPRALSPAERRAQLASASGAGERLVNRGAREGSAEPTTGPATRPGRRGFDRFASRALEFAHKEGALVVVTPSTRGDGGTFFVQGASIPGESPFGGRGPTTRAGSEQEPSTNPATRPVGPTTRPRVWAKDAPKIPPQIMLAIEDYNRLVRMLKSSDPPKVSIDLQVEFHDDDDMAYNTIAEIPGTDPQLKDQIVMVGAHLDSWHSGTGATDNAVGATAAMEAVRIIKALDLKPRRTIRVALWTGEEQGLYGSAAYVKKHFGHDPDAESRRAVERARRMAEQAGENPSEVGVATPATTAPTARNIAKGPDYEKLSAYFNLDNGTGKIRGIYAQSNPAAVPIFRQWLAYFGDIGANTVTLSNTGSTDHVSFDQIGLPGFQFIQDQIEYNSRTHHSNQDVYDRIQLEDIKQASTIMAAFVWKTANMDERFPRKLMDSASGR